MLTLVVPYNLVGSSTSLMGSAKVTVSSWRGILVASRHRSRYSARSWPRPPPFQTGEVQRLSEGDSHLFYAPIFERYSQRMPISRSLPWMEKLGVLACILQINRQYYLRYGTNKHSTRAVRLSARITLHLLYSTTYQLSTNRGRERHAPVHGAAAYQR